VTPSSGPAIPPWPSLKPSLAEIEHEELAAAGDAFDPEGVLARETGAVTVLEVLAVHAHLAARDVHPGVAAALEAEGRALPFIEETCVDDGVGVDRHAPVA